MDLTKGDMRGHLLQLALPSSVAFLFGTLLYIVDTYFAGKISTEAQAALSVSFPVYFIIISVLQGVSVGSQTMIANALGEGNARGVKLFCAQALSFGMISSLLLTVFGYFFTRTILEVIGVSGEALDHASFYVEYTFLSSFFLVLTNTMSAILLAHGIARPFRNWVIISFLMHFIGDPWLIYGGLGIPALGFAGIVYTTVITVMTGSLFLGFCLYESGIMKDARFQDLIPRRHEFWELTKQGLPACMNMISIAFGLLLIMGFILYFGETAAAAYGIGIRIQQLFLLPTLGIAVSALAIISQNNGAKRYDRVQECLKEAFLFGSIVMTVGFLFMMGIPEIIMGLFSQDQQVIAIGSSYLRISSITCYAFLAIQILTSALQGMKHPLSAFVIGFGRQVIFPLLILPALFLWYEVTLNLIWIMLLVVNFIFAMIAYILTKRAIDRAIRINKEIQND